MHLVEIVFENEFTPDLNDLSEEGLCLLQLVFLLEKFTHVVIARAHAVGLGSMLNALKEDALSQVIDRVSEGLGGVLSEEKAAESFMQARLKALDVLV